MEQERKSIQVEIITGMSGAGKTVAIQCFEDLGYYCVDNLPPSLISTFIDLIETTENKTDKVAFVVDLRTREFFDHLFASIDQLDQRKDLSTHILFLDAKEQVLVSRYKETRRSHPLASEDTPLEGIQLEREMLQELKGRARHIIDTSSLKPRELRERILTDYAEKNQSVFNMNVMSFGFKYGMPIDADLVFDVRFLPNPHYVEHLEPKTGLEEEVSSYVLKWTDTKEFINKLVDMLEFMLPLYKQEGKSQLVVAIGCTGGKHRSVTLAEYIASYFSGKYETNANHRDIEEGRKK